MRHYAPMFPVVLAAALADNDGRMVVSDPAEVHSAMSVSSPVVKTLHRRDVTTSDSTVPEAPMRAGAHDSARQPLCYTGQRGGLAALRALTSPPQQGASFRSWLPSVQGCNADKSAGGLRVRCDLREDEAIRIVGAASV